MTPCGEQHIRHERQGDTVIELLLECTLPVGHDGDHYDVGAIEEWPAS